MASLMNNSHSEGMMSGNSSSIGHFINVLLLVFKIDLSDESDIAVIYPYNIDLILLGIGIVVDIAKSLSLVKSPYFEIQVGVAQISYFINHFTLEL